MMMLKKYEIREFKDSDAKTFRIKKKEE